MDVLFLKILVVIVAAPFVAEILRIFLPDAWDAADPAHDEILLELEKNRTGRRQAAGLDAIAKRLPRSHDEASPWARDEWFVPGFRAESRRSHRPNAFERQKEGSRDSVGSRWEGGFGRKGF